MRNASVNLQMQDTKSYNRSSKVFCYKHGPDLLGHGLHKHCVLGVFIIKMVFAEFLHHMKKANCKAVDWPKVGGTRTRDITA